MPLPASVSPDDLRVFVQVAERAGFSAAALALDLPRATVSTAVARLEAQLGARLLQRTTRRVQLTADGQTVLQLAQALLAELDELQGLFQRESAGLAGRLRVDMPLGVARALVLPRLGDWLAQHPQLAIEVCSTDRRVDPIAEGFDCVLRVGAVAADGLVARPLGAMAMASIASTAYIAHHGLPATPDDLDGHRLVHYQPNPGVRPPGFEWLDPLDGGLRTRPMTGAVTVNNSEAYLAACEAGLGIIQIPRARAATLLRAGAVQEILPQLTPPPMPVTLLYPHRRHLPRRVRGFMDWLAGLLQTSAVASDGRAGTVAGPTIEPDSKFAHGTP